MMAPGRLGRADGWAHGTADGLAGGKNVHVVRSHHVAKLACRGAGGACALAMLLLIAACEKTFENMYDQARYKPLASSPLWSDGRASRPPVEGALAHSRGSVAGTSSGRDGLSLPQPAVDLPAALASAERSGRPPSSTGATQAGYALSMLERGGQRYDIFCAPCHGAAGDGDGMIARRGFPHPPTFHDARLRDASDDYLVAVITHGVGIMYPHADRIAPDDRRAIVAYIRALQLSQHARLADVPLSARAGLER